MMNREDLENFLNTFADKSKNENVELYRALIEKCGFKNFYNPEDFFFGMVYPFENFIDGLLSVEVSNNNDVKFLYKQHNYVERHFTKLFEMFEGSACSADKGNTVVLCLLNFYKTGECIEFDYAGEYTYHLPKKIFKDHESIIEYYVAIRDFFYGSHDKYLKAIINLKKDFEL